MRGQAEAVIILAIIIVAVLVSVYMLQLSELDIPFLSSPAQRLARESAENSIRSATLDALRSLSLNGGYPDPQQGSVSLGGETVPYWMLNGQISMPDFRGSLEEGTRKRITDTMPLLEKSLEGSGVAFGEPQVSVSILPDRIDVAVNMPTTVKGESIPQPYRVSIRSLLSESLEFSANFLESQKANRFFEVFTVSSMLYSDIEGEIQKVPVQILLTDCGQSVQKTYEEIRPEVEKVVKSTVAHTYLPGQYPEGIIDQAGFPKYSLISYDGNEYSDLDVNFWLPDGFSLDRNMLAFSPEPITATAQQIPLTGLCESEHIYVKYSVHYPVIVSVEDPLTRIPLRFAFNAIIFDNMPAPYEDLPQLQPTYCDNPQCTMDLTVVDSSGRPLDNAFVSFIGCGMGETSEGRLVAGAPCGLGSLYVSKDGYTPYADLHNSDSIRGLTVELRKRPLVSLKFWEVNVRKEPPVYRILEGVGGNSDITPVRDGAIVIMTLISNETGLQFSPSYESKGGYLDLPAGNYIIQGSLVEQDTVKALGSFITTFELMESHAGKDIHIYLPYTFGYAGLQTDEERYLASLELTALLDACGIGAIREAELESFGGCVKEESEILV